MEMNGYATRHTRSPAPIRCMQCLHRTIKWSYRPMSSSKTSKDVVAVSSRALFILLFATL